MNLRSETHENRWIVHSQHPFFRIMREGRTSNRFIRVHVQSRLEDWSTHKCVCLSHNSFVLWCVRFHVNNQLAFILYWHTPLVPTTADSDQMAMNDLVKRAYDLEVISKSQYFKVRCLWISTVVFAFDYINEWVKCNLSKQRFFLSVSLAYAVSIADSLLGGKRRHSIRALCSESCLPQWHS